MSITPTSDLVSAITSLIILRKSSRFTVTGALTAIDSVTTGTLGTVLALNIASCASRLDKVEVVVTLFPIQLTSTN